MRQFSPCQREKKRLFFYFCRVDKQEKKRFFFVYLTVIKSHLALRYQQSVYNKSKIFLQLHFKQCSSFISSFWAIKLCYCNWFYQFFCSHFFFWNKPFAVPRKLVYGDLKNHCENSYPIFNVKTINQLMLVCFKQFQAMERYFQINLK